MAKAKDSNRSIRTLTNRRGVALVIFNSNNDQTRSGSFVPALWSFPRWFSIDRQYAALVVREKRHGRCGHSFVPRPSFESIVTLIKIYEFFPPQLRVTGTRLRIKNLSNRKEGKEGWKRKKKIKEEEEKNSKKRGKGMLRIKCRSLSSFAAK